MSHLVKYIRITRVPMVLAIFLQALLVFLTLQTSPLQAQAAEATASETENTGNDFENLLQQELDNAASQNQKQEEISWGWQIVRTSLVLTFILGFFYGVFRLYRFRQTLPSYQSAVFKPLGHHPLGSGRQLQLLELGNRLLVISISEAGVQKITEITEKHEIDLLRLESQKEAGQAPPVFLAELTKAIRQKVDNWKPADRLQPEPEKETSWEEARQNSRKKLQKLRDEKESLKKRNLDHDE